MKNSLTCFLCLFTFILVSAQKDMKKETVNLLKSSELVIAGSTNVNKFNCEFDISKISGERTIRYREASSELTFEDLELHLRIDAFDCGNKKMNADFQDLLVSEDYPEIVISINRVDVFSEEYVKAYITLEIAGIKNQYELPVHLVKNRLIGKLKLNIRDFKLEPPKKALGLIQVDEMIEVQFNLKVKN